MLLHLEHACSVDAAWVRWGGKRTLAMGGGSSFSGRRAGGWTSGPKLKPTKVTLPGILYRSAAPGPDIESGGALPTNAQFGKPVGDHG